MKEGGEESDESSTNGFGNYGSTYPADSEAEKAETNPGDVLKAAVKKARENTQLPTNEDRHPPFSSDEQTIAKVVDGLWASYDVDK